MGQRIDVGDIAVDRHDDNAGIDGGLHGRGQRGDVVRADHQSVHLLGDDCVDVFDFSMKVRTGGAQWFAEAVAAFGLVATILAGIRFQRTAVPWLVGLYITAAYWFTASTSFANPAVAIARSLTNTFSGIRPVDLPGFIVAELCGAFVGIY